MAALARTDALKRLEGTKERKAGSSTMTNQELADYLEGLVREDHPDSMDSIVFGEAAERLKAGAVEDPPEAAPPRPSIDPPQDQADDWERHYYTRDTAQKILVAAVKSGWAIGNTTTKDVADVAVFLSDLLFNTQQPNAKQEA